MPNLNDMTNFLNKDDLTAGDILIFKDAGEIKDVDFSQAKDGSGVKTVFQIIVELPDGREKLLTMNKTSQAALSAEWGNVTEEWVNKKAKVTFIKQMTFGKVANVLALEPVTQGESLESKRLFTTEREPGREG